MRDGNERGVHMGFNNYSYHPKTRLNNLALQGNNQQLNKASIDNKQRMQDFTNKQKQYKSL